MNDNPFLPQRQWTPASDYGTPSPHKIGKALGRRPVRVPTIRKNRIARRLHFQWAKGFWGPKDVQLHAIVGLYREWADKMMAGETAEMSDELYAKLVDFASRVHPSGSGEVKPDPRWYGDIVQPDREKSTESKGVEP